jgi:hypothetical protein
MLQFLPVLIVLSRRYLYSMKVWVNALEELEKAM